MLDCFAYALVPNLVDVCKQLLTSWPKNINTGYLTFYGALSMSQNAIKFSEKKVFPTASLLQSRWRTNGASLLQIQLLASCIVIRKSVVALDIIYTRAYFAHASGNMFFCILVQYSKIVVLRDPSSSCCIRVVVVWQV